MTEHAEHDGVEARPQPAPGAVVHRNEVVQLADLALANPLVERHFFENCLVVGPAVIAPLEDISFVGCSFDGNPRDLFFEVPAGPQRGMVGVIGLRDVHFYACAIQGIGMMGPPELLAYFESAVGGGA